MKLFSIDSILNSIKLSQNGLEKEHDQFGHWPAFYAIYTQCYPKDTLACKYSTIKKHTTNYAVAETKE